MRRERLEIAIEILEFCKEEKNKTNLVYGVNLNFRMADKYLSYLRTKGFMEEKSNKFITTENGVEFLKKAKDVLTQL